MTRLVAEVLATAAARWPDHPAVISGSDTTSYQRLWQAAGRYAAALNRLGIRPGDRVAVCVPNGTRFAEVYFGVLAAGAVVVPLNVLLRAPEIAYVLQDSGARLLVCADATRAEGMAAAQPAGVRMVTVGLTGPDVIALEDLAEGMPPVQEPQLRRPDAPAAVLYTSGTTGRPKGAMLTNGNLMHNIETCAVTPFQFSPDDVLLCSLPLSHIFGQICALATGFHAGITIVVMERFAAQPALQLMNDHGCTVFMGVPTMYLALLDAVAEGAPRPQLRRAYSGGAALPVSVLRRVQDVFGAPVYEGYGLTETGPVVAYNHPGIVCRPGTVGQAIPGVQVNIARADLEDGVMLLPPGEVGEVVVRSPSVMAGYLGRPEDSAAVLVDGWFRTGDLGVLSPDGYLRIVDRKKDMLVRGGYKVYPREVEEVLSRHPAVAQVAVVGVPHPRLGEEVCAVVVLRGRQKGGSGLADELVAYGRDRLASYKYPRQVRFVSELPLGPTGKVLKHRLAEPAVHALSG